MTIREIAELSGVSVSTVSKVMNGKDAGISAETRKRVLEVAKRYNYKPYASAMQRDTRTLVIGVLVHDLAGSAHVVSGISAVAREQGYSILLKESGGAAEGEREGIAALMGQHVDGILWEPSSADDQGRATKLGNAGIPLITFGAGAATAGIDYASLCYAAVSVLVDYGHTSIACISSDDSEGERFRTGYQKALFDKRLSTDEGLELICRQDDAPPLAVIHQSSAAVISSYPMAVRFWQQAMGAGYSIPRDYSLIALRGDEHASLGFLPISAISVPESDYGRHLAEALIDTIEKRDRRPAFETPAAIDSLASVGVESAKGKRIVSFGSINIDNYLSFESLPHSGTSASTSMSATFPGGKCLNEAIGAARLGHAVSAIGRVGDDADADTIYEALALSGVDASAVERTASHRTGQAYIFVEKTGASMISIMSGANGALCADDVRACERSFRDADICLLQTEVPMDAVVQAAATAKEHGAMTVLKPSDCKELPRELLDSIDILVPNADELRAICPDGATVEERVGWLKSNGAGTVIVTMGPGGCCIYDGADIVHIPALDVASIDSTGAGDAFISALAAYLLYGYDCVDAARIATYAAGLSTLRQGVSTSLVDRDTLEAYIMQHEPELLGA